MNCFVLKCKCLQFSFFLVILSFLWTDCVSENLGDDVTAVRRGEFVSKTVNDLGFRLFPELVAGRLPDTDSNVVFSPLSITLALSMVYLGAANTTALEIENCLFGGHITEKIKNEFHKQWKGLIESIINGDKDHPNVDKVNLANGLWFSQDLNQIEEKFQRDLMQYYNAIVKTVDFSGPDSVTEINKWIGFETSSKIQSVIEEDAIDKDTVFVLSNVLYFKGLWLEMFLTEATYDSQFIINSTKQVGVKMMRKKSTYDIYYDHVLQLQVLKLPYSNGTCAMFVALPHEMDTFSQLHTYLSHKQLDIWEKSLYQMVVDVHLPKFTLSATYKLKQVIENLGIEKLFNVQSANLSGISLTQPVHVSSIVHKSFIEVNEQGTEASAATVIHARKRSLDPEFIADHPFIFWIRHIETKTLLFLGQIAWPSIVTTNMDEMDFKGHTDL